jgi:hypothetical protein
VAGALGEQAGQQLAAGDLDGDGRDELVFCVASPRRTWIASGLSAGQLEVPGTWLVEGGADPAIVDADLDGQLDLWLADDTEMNLFVGPIDADRDPSMAWASVALGWVAGSPVLTDVDADGDQDLVFASSWVLAPAEIGVVTSPVPAGLTIPSHVLGTYDLLVEEAISSSDVDGDGTDEIVLVAASSWYNRVFSGAALLVETDLRDTILLELPHGPVGTLEIGGVRQPVVASGPIIGAFDL